MMLLYNDAKQDAQDTASTRMPGRPRRRYIQTKFNDPIPPACKYSSPRLHTTGAGAVPPWGASLPQGLRPGDLGAPSMCMRAREGERKVLSANEKESGGIGATVRLAAHRSVHVLCAPTSRSLPTIPSVCDTCFARPLYMYMCGTYIHV